MLAAAPMSLSTSQAVRVAPFARSCQAAHLLGKVLHHIDDGQLRSSGDYMYDEALQLHRTMCALADVLRDEASEDDPILRPSLCTSMAMCYSGLLTLYDAYSCTERVHEHQCETQLVMQKESIEGLSEFSGRVVQLAQRIRGVIDSDGIGRLNPMVIDCVYQAAANCMSNPSATTVYHQG